MNTTIEFFKDKKNITWIAFFGLLLLAMIVMSIGAGMNGDEEMQAIQADNVINYYKSFGNDTAAVSTTIMKNGNPEYWNLPLYGQVIDNFAGLIARIFKIDDLMMTRHIVNSIFGWLGILFVSLMAFRISGQKRAAIFAALLLFLSPRFLGHSFNNIKDVSFATAMMMGVYYIYVFLQELPKPKKSTIIMLIISMAFAMAVRIPGILLIPYFGLFSLLFIFKQYFINKSQQKKTTANKKKVKITLPKEQNVSYLFKRLLLFGIGISLASYILMVLLWPYAIEAPIEHVKEAFGGMSQFATAIRQNFEGSMQWSDALPWYYTPKYILITIPIAVILGLLVYPFVGGLKKENRFSSFIVYFSFLFPIFWIVYTNANVYGGWRHSLFAYLPMVVAAALGFDALVDFVKNKYAKIVLTVLPFLLLLPPFIHIVKNHPYEYIYFNEFAGGVKGAHGNYELDYYYHSTREASEWIIENAKKTGLETSDKIIVTTWHPASVSYYFRHDTDRFQVGFARWYERGNWDWDYGIFVITGISPELQKSLHFPPKNTVHTIDVDGKPICLILKRTDKSDMIGNQFKEQQQFDSALFYLNKAIALEPANQAVLFNLIEIYFNTNQIEKAKENIDKLLAIEAHNETGNLYLMNYYLFNNQIDNAMQICNLLKTINFKNPQAYMVMSNIYMNRGNLRAAEQELLMLIDFDRLDNQTAQQLIKIYQAQGLNERAATKKLYKALADSYKKRGKEDQYYEYLQIYERI